MAPIAGVPQVAGSPSSRSLSTDDLVTLNREIAALVRAGVPLELGLRGLSASVPRRLGRLTDRLAERVRQGESFTEALEFERGTLPPLYRAVVRAGLRSGRLPAALETLSAYARSLIDLRRRIVVALIYPAIVLTAACVLFGVVLHRVAAELAETHAMFDLPRRGWVTVLEAAGRYVAAWGWIVPAAIVAVVLWSLVSSGLVGREVRLGGPLLAALPGMKRLNRSFRTSTFADVLAMLIEHGLPLDESLGIAAEASGDRRLTAEMATLAESIRNGGPLTSGLEQATVLPGLARWMIAAGERQGALAVTLRQVAELYRRRAQQQADWIKVLVPVAVVVLVGGGAVLFYALALFVPMTTLLRDLVV
jgi:general secretion pathway protein F